MTARKKDMKSTRSKDGLERVIPTTAGMDLYNRDGTLDAHIRVESYKKLGTEIYVDLFDSGIADASEAHITSESFQYGASGAKGATQFLHETGFRVTVVMK